MTHLTATLAAILVLGATTPRAFQLLSSSFTDEGTIAMAQVYTAAGGGNTSPELHWAGAPAGTKSYALTCYDPDARHGWWHWLEIDLSPSTKSLAAGEGDVSTGQVPSTSTDGPVFLTNSFRSQGYDGPCPPIGDAPHHYVFTLYALDVSALLVKVSDTPDVVNGAILAHTIGKTVLVGRFGR